MAEKNKKSRRPKPMVAKAGLSRDPKRGFGNGGKIYCKGGKLK